MQNTNDIVSIFSSIKQKVERRTRPFDAINILDPTIATENLGDKIIMSAVENLIRELFPDLFFIHIPTHLPQTYTSRTLLSRGKFSIVGGTNAINNSILTWRCNWRVRVRDLIWLRNIILLGVGWKGYEHTVAINARVALRRMLSKNFIHSVRDEYTKKMLNLAGIQNVLNTGCVTMWNLTPSHVSMIPAIKGDSVVFTINEGHRDPVDKELIKILRKHYTNVYFWPQGIYDREYLENIVDLNFTGINTLSPSLQSYDRLLEDQSVSIDYVGSRLHGGIRALQNQRRTIVLSVDNRATEIAKDTKLPVVSKSDIDKIENMICGNWHTTINLPREAIRDWKQQFNKMRW